VSPALLYGFAAGCLGPLGLHALMAGRRGALGAARLPGAMRALGTLTDAVVSAGREGRDPGTAERRRLLLAGAAVALALGTLVLGPAAGLALAAGAPWTLARVLAGRRDRYRRAIGGGASAIAGAVADALSGGHSLRGALSQAATGLTGPPGRELGRVARELALGVRTDDALEALRARAGSTAIDTIVAASLIQRRAGGDLAHLLRECARSFEDQERLAAEARAATAQARFTGLVVVLLPLGGALLAELANPGYAASLLHSPLTIWLAGVAIALQAVAAVSIRRLARVRE